MSESVLQRMATLVADHSPPAAPEAAWDLYETIQAFLHTPSYHLVFEAALIIWILSLLFCTKSYKPDNKLTEKEKADLIEDWKPEPLVPDHHAVDPTLQRMETRVVEGKIDKRVTVNGNDCLNLGSFNFLGMIGRKDIEDEAVKALRKYGVGSCGPRGFYGTVDVHLTLEEKLQQFMGCEEAIVYSYCFSAIASAIPAYSKRGDVIFADEGCHFAIQKGILASRSRVVYFKHNDMEDLERCLQDQAKADKKNPKKAKVTRRFVVVEGLYMNYGDICPLKKLVELKHKYKVRIFMDETISFGSLGATGRGVTEHFGISIDEIDLMTASLEHSLGSTGGFCAGKAYVIDHQRLSGLGYCFSASTPPLLSHAAIVALGLLDSNPEEYLDALRENAKHMHRRLEKLAGLKVVGENVSPVKHICLVDPSGEHELDKITLAKIVTGIEQRGIAVALSSYLESEEHCLPPPSIRLTVNVNLTNVEIDEAVSVIREVSEEIM